MVDLFSGVGGTGQNFRNTILADDAPISIADGQAPFTGRFRPLNPLAAFDGQPFANGSSGLFFLFDPTACQDAQQLVAHCGLKHVQFKRSSRAANSPDGSS